MKTKITVMLVILLMGTAMAQDRKDRPNRKGDRTEISAEQKAELITKKMTLKLDLNKSQQDKVMALHLDNFSKMETKRKELKANREDGKRLTKEERHDQKLAMLDHKIEMKNEMKSILNAEQFEKWEASKKSPRKMKGKRGDKDSHNRRR